jgi:hypothetical protein
MTLAVSIAQSGANNVTMRNKIINGAMMIDQRNNGASVTPSGTDTSAYVLDRWYLRYSVGSKLSVQRSTTAPTGYINSQILTSLSAYSIGASEHFSTSQAIEGFNCADLNWGTANAATVTLSFVVRSSLTGTFGGMISNDAGNRSYVFSYAINSANTWETKTITIAGDQSGTWKTDNGGGLYVNFSVGAGSSVTNTAGAWYGSLYRSVTGQTSVVGTNGATFYITGVQLEAGTTATAFEQRLYGTELALCQRYYQIIRTGMGLGNTTVQVIVNSGLPVTMRATPSLSQQGVVEIGSGNADRTQSSVSTTFLNGADNSVTYLLGNYTGLTVTAPYQFRLSANTNGVTASAEL